MRVSYLLANRCFVVSETGSDAAVEERVRGRRRLREYDRLVDTCLAYLRERAAAARSPRAASQIVSSLGEADFLRPLVGELAHA